MARDEIDPDYVLPEGEWRKAKIAYNADGNIVVLDPEVAARLRDAARSDRELEIAISPKQVTLERPDWEEIVLKNGSLRPMNTLCACDVLRFHLVKEQPVQHRLLSTQPRVERPEEA